MIISYKWLSEYLPTKIEAEKLSKILTAIGLEVESLHTYESIKGGLQGLIIGEVLTCEKHPDADKLKITTVNVGQTEPLQIVCGASNVAAGQKVIVATVGTTIYPSTGEPFTIKKAKIRGIESHGMLCAEDEIGLGTGHDGIMIMPEDTVVGKAVSAIFENYDDQIFEIGLTPNRMDAMSHLGVARDVCAYLSHHDKKETLVKSPLRNNLKVENPTSTIEVEVQDAVACPRYAGISINNITVGESPAWLQNKLKAIGVKPISNIVDITNFILHETGQPLHAFDADQIQGNKIIVGHVPDETKFISLDNKERILKSTDLTISNANSVMCIAGVYGGLESGVGAQTKNIFIESAWFNPQSIRKSSLRLGLRTDAATRFEKGVDISNTVNVLKRAAALIVELCGGELSSNIIDIYPQPIEPKSVGLKYHYLKKLSGKNYHGDTVKNILTALGFVIVKDNIDELFVNVPLSKPDIEIPADIVEEIMRIDGLDNIDIPSAITISPSVSNQANHNALYDKIAGYLTGAGFNEIFTNSITNSKYYSEEILAQSVKMINNLSADLDILRPSMLETGLEVIAHNINRRNTNLSLFELGKTYTTSGIGKYEEIKNLAIYNSGDAVEADWQQKGKKASFFYLKAICERIFSALGVSQVTFQQYAGKGIEEGAQIFVNKQIVGEIGAVSKATLQKFDIKQPVFYANLLWLELIKLSKTNLRYKEVPKFPAVQRDLALIVDNKITYQEIETIAQSAKLQHLQSLNLFDVFKSDKLGANKKSLAVSFTFLDDTKTLTDVEIDGFMTKLIHLFEKNIEAEIRR